MYGDTSIGSEFRYTLRRVEQQNKEAIVCEQRNKMIEDIVHKIDAQGKKLQGKIGETNKKISKLMAEIDVQFHQLMF